MPATGAFNHHLLKALLWPPFLWSPSQSPCCPKAVHLGPSGLISYCSSPTPPLNRASWCLLPHTQHAQPPFSAVMNPPPMIGPAPFKRGRRRFNHTVAMLNRWSRLYHFSLSCKRSPGVCSLHHPQECNLTDPDAITLL